MSASRFFRASQRLGRRSQLRNVSRMSLVSVAVIKGLYSNHAYADSSFAHLPDKPSVPPPQVGPKAKATMWRRLHRLYRWLQSKIETLISLVSRYLYLVFAFSPATLTLPLLLSDNDALKRWWWALLRDCVRRSGPCPTKFAQWIATRPDLFPLSLCRNLEDLQSKTLKHRWADTEEALLLAFGEHWRDTLHIQGEYPKGSSTFSPMVLGSGCVAQVLKGSLGDRQVAIKIIHPGVRAAIKADVTILRFLSWLMEVIPGTENFSLSECVEEFSSLMMLQLDMKLEADNLDRFRRNFHLSREKVPPSNSLSGKLGEIVRRNVGATQGKVTFPEPLRPYVSDSVLVESYEPGRQIPDILGQLDDKKLRREIALAGLDAILKMVFEDNFIHADLHPGNVIFREHFPHDAPSSSSGPSSSLLGRQPEGVIPSGWELSFIDAGLVSTLEKDDRRNFIELFAAVVKNDGRRVGELMVDRSKGGGAKCTNREAFALEIAELVNTVHKSGLSLGRVGIGALLQRVLVLCYLHQVKLEPKFVSVMIAMGVVEGLGKRLDPDVDVLMRAAPYVLKAALFV